MRYPARLMDPRNERDLETEIVLPDRLHPLGTRIAVTIEGAVWIKFGQSFMPSEGGYRLVLYLRPALGSVENERRYALESEAGFLDLTHLPQPSPRR